MYREFYSVKKELENQNQHFDAESLQLLKYGDLILAAVGNAGDAITSMDLVNIEQTRRLEAIKDYSIKQICDDFGVWAIVDDDSMYYAWFNSQTRDKELKIEDAPNWRLLVEAMEDLRGDWSDGRRSFFLKEIYRLIPLAREEGLVPEGWLDAVQNNADTFDGDYNDGRIMRDGQLFLSKAIADQYNLPEGGVSGNIAKMLGAVPVEQKGYRGSYEELFEKILTPEQKLCYTTRLAGKEE